MQCSWTDKTVASKWKTIFVATEKLLIWETFQQDIHMRNTFSQKWRKFSLKIRDSPERQIKQKNVKIKATTYYIPQHGERIRLFFDYMKQLSGDIHYHKCLCHCHTLG